MALRCSSSVAHLDAFEFIDCSTISISYNSQGIATVNFSVVSSRSTLMNDYTDLVFGNVRFLLYVQNVQVQKIPGTMVNVFQLTLTGFGCER
jgi:hypothetical protein